MPSVSFASATARPIGSEGSSESSYLMRPTFCAIVIAPAPPPLPAGRGDSAGAASGGAPPTHSAASRGAVRCRR